MGFFDNLGKAITDVGNSAIQKGKDAANVAKYNRMITDEEKETAKLFEELGRGYFEAHKEDYEEQFTETIDRVKESYAKIESYKQLINELQNAGKCQNCGAELPSGASFCPECGTKVIIPEETEEEPEKKTCAECGAEVIPGHKFCMTCGAKLEEESAEEVTEEVISETPDNAEEAAKAPEDTEIPVPDTEE